MKGNLVSKLKIELTREENDTLYRTRDILAGIAETLDDFGFLNDELDDKITKAVDVLDYFTELDEIEFSRDDEV